MQPINPTQPSDGQTGWGPVQRAEDSTQTTAINAVMAAINNDSQFAQTMATALASKADATVTAAALAGKDPAKTVAAVVTS